MWFTVQIPWLVFSMSSTLTLNVITVIFVFQRKCFLWSSCICVYSSYFQRKLSEKPFIFIFLQNERKFWLKFATILLVLRDNLFCCPWNLLEAQVEENLFISMITTMQSCLIFFVKPLKRRTWKIRKSWKNN